MRLLQLLAFAGLILAGMTESAFAGPAIAAAGGFIAWLASGTLAATLVSAGIRLAIGLGLSFLAKKIKEKHAREDIPGLSGTLYSGGTIPRSAVIGRYPAEASLEYANTWGTDGKTPNAYLVMVISLSDLPVAGLAEVWINGEQVTLGDEHADYGYAVTEYNADDKDHLWIKFYDGTQSAVDPYLFDKFGAAAERTYDAGRIATGCAYAIITALVNPDLFASWPKALFVLDGIALYDVREDDTAGGEGDQRWDTPATWTQADGAANPIVAAYNILRGIRYDGDWVYGGQTITDASLPYSSWSAAMSECDVDIDLAGGGTEKQFRTGLVFRFDSEPAETVERLLGACAGLVAEIGGRYKTRVGAAGAAVFSITDDDIRVDDDAQFDPFPSLAVTVNGIASRYVEPQESWALKDAPQLRRPELEVEDGGRRQIAEIIFEAVTSATQVERLQQAALLDERAFRRHALPLPPEAFLLEPIDVISWTSERNGYTNKLFDVLELDDLAGFDTSVGLKELDPSAYDWDESDELPVTVAPPVRVRPPAQPMAGWSAQGVLVTTEGVVTEDPGGQRKPGCLLEWDADVDDVVGVRVQIRIKTSGEVVFDGTTSAWEAGETVTTQNLVSLTTYQARGRYVPGGSRATDWSAWLDFTTPDARVSRGELDAELDARIQMVEDRIGELLTLREDLDAVSTAIATQTSVLLEQVGRTRTSLGVRYEENAAGIEEVRQVTATNQEALAALFLELFAINEDTGEATVNFRAIAQAAPEGALAAAALQLRAGNTADDEWAEASIELAAFWDSALDRYYSRVRLKGDQVDIIVKGQVLPAIMLAVAAVPQDTPIVASSPDDIITPDLSSRRKVYRTLLNGDAELQFPELPDDPGAYEWVHIFEQDNTGGHTLSLGDGFIGSAPDLELAGESVTICDGLILSVDPPVAIITKRASAGLSGPLPTEATFFLDTPGVHEFVVPYHNTITVELWGASGGSGAGGIESYNNGGPGGDTKLNPAGTGEIKAGGGEGGEGNRNGGKGGKGGVATGGNTTNTNGEDGNDGFFKSVGDENGGPGRYGGAGGDSPNGGAGAPDNGPPWVAGVKGAFPGGGSSGGASNWDSRGGGGSGAGAYAKSVFTAGTIPPGTVIQITVGAGGIAGTGHSDGADGQHGRVKISVT